MIKFLATEYEFMMSSRTIQIMLSLMLHTYLLAVYIKLEDKLLMNWRMEPCFAIIANETMDSERIEQFAIYVCFFKSEIGFVKQYLGLVKLSQTTAKCLNNNKGIMSFLLAERLNITKVLFVIFDGFNTMSGRVKKVQKLFRHYSVPSIYINCRKYKLAFCFKHLM